MKRFANLKRLGFFTRLLDEAPPAERYRFAAEQIVRAESAGLDSAWIAQHHFHEREGGLPSPFAFLGYVAAQTSRIGSAPASSRCRWKMRCGWRRMPRCSICSANGRFELGVGTGGNPSAFAAFGLDSAQRNGDLCPQSGRRPHRPGRQAARRRRYALSAAAAIVTSGSGRRRSRSAAARARARRAMACCCRAPSPDQGGAEGDAGRDPESGHRCLSRSAAAGMRAPDHGLAQRLRRRRSDGGDAPCRYRAAARAAAVPQGRSRHAWRDAGAR